MQIAIVENIFLKNPAASSFSLTYFSLTKASLFSWFNAFSFSSCILFIWITLFSNWSINILFSSHFCFKDLNNYLKTYQHPLLTGILNHFKGFVRHIFAILFFKLGKMFFISLRKSFSFSRSSNSGILKS